MPTTATTSSNRHNAEEQRRIHGANAAAERARADLAQHDTLRSSLVRGDKDRTALRDRIVLERERLGIRHRLGQDRQGRADLIAANPPAHVTARLGSRPDEGPTAALWDDAAARIDQHRTAFRVTDLRRALGARPGFAEGAIAISYQATAEACQRVDRALGRGAAIETPSVGVGLEL